MPLICQLSWKCLFTNWWFISKEKLDNCMWRHQFYTYLHLSLLLHGQWPQMDKFCKLDNCNICRCLCNCQKWTLGDRYWWQIQADLLFINESSIKLVSKAHCLGLYYAWKMRALNEQWFLILKKGKNIKEKNPGDRLRSKEWSEMNVTLY